MNIHKGRGEITCASSKQETGKRSDKERIISRIDQGLADPVDGLNGNDGPNYRDGAPPRDGGGPTCFRKTPSSVNYATSAPKPRAKTGGPFDIARIRGEDAHKFVPGTCV